MLVLSRRTDEFLRIGDNILVRVLGVKGRVVRLGIDAPSDIPILRGELTTFDPTGACRQAGDAQEARAGRRARGPNGRRTGAA
ncbi:carbon storage regulator [Posidoniimonas corsicana]|uniref:carbon storage regulator n=1 Tax=Posidoniimonas corsicana TaxID=1938618 RepID=UPI0011B78F4F